MFDQCVVKLFHFGDLNFNPPVPPLRVVSFPFPLGLCKVSQSVVHPCKWWEYIEWVPDDDESFVSCKRQTFWTQKWMVCFDDPCRVIDNAFTFESHKLKPSYVLSHYTTCDNTWNIFNDLSKERVARSWIRGKRDLIPINGISMQESVFTIKHPLLRFY